MFDAIQAGEDAMPIERSPARADDIFLTTQELAERWQLEVTTLANARSRGEGVPFVKLPTGAIRYKMADILAAEREGARGFSWEALGRALTSFRGSAASEASEIIAHLKKAMKD